MPAEIRLKEENPTDHHNHFDWRPKLDRRAALRLLSMSAVASMTSCGGGKASSTTTTTTSTATATTTTLASSASSVEESASVTLTAEVSPSAATGTLTFYDGTTSIGTGTLASGAAELATTFNTTGAHALTAEYAGSTDYAASTSSTVSVTVTAPVACSETLEGEEGPYFVDDSATGYLRSNILTNLDGTDEQSGIPLALTIYVYDAKNSCAALQSVQVDIWHCNSNGVYSAEESESTTGQSWLRGYQITDATGKVQFTTIIPGWYEGRTTHIHLRLRSTYDDTDDSGTNTMQLFFDQTLVDTIDTTIAPYSSEGKNSTTNASDRVYSQQEDGTTLMSLTGNTTDGYSASFNVYLPITAVS